MDTFEFEWDDEKAKANFKKHQVRFSEAMSVWLDSRSLEIFDVCHSEKEERWVRLGLSLEAKILTVVYCEIVDRHRIRIISARAATLQEAKNYFRGRV